MVFIFSITALSFWVESGSQCAAVIGKFGNLIWLYGGTKYV